MAKSPIPSTLDFFLLIFAVSTHLAPGEGSFATLQWKPVPQTGTQPSHRYGGCVQAIDSGTRILVSGGSREDRVIFSDAYTLDLTSLVWARTASLSRGRYFAGCTAAGADMYVFGGRAPSLDNELWRYSGADNQWEQIAATNKPRVRESMRLTAVNSTTLVTFGGLAELGALNDLWAFDIPSSTWRSLQTAGSLEPAPRAFFCQTLSPDGRRLVVFGGSTGGDDPTEYNDLWELDLETLEWKEVLPNGDLPWTLRDITCTTDLDSMYVVFGWSDIRNRNYHQIHRYNFTIQRWDTFNIDNIEGTGRDTVQVTAVNGLLYIFGGWGYESILNDLITCDTRASVVTCDVVHGRADFPVARKFHAGAVIGDSLYVHGGTGAIPTTRGIDNTVAFSDLWRRRLLPIEPWELVVPDSSIPTPRFGHSGLTWGDRLVIFGGISLTGDLYRDLAEYSAATNRWMTSTPSNGATWPQARSAHAAALLGDTMYIYGGSGSQRVLADLWVVQLKTVQWRQMVVPKGSGPDGLQFAGLVVWLTTRTDVSLLLLGGTTNSNTCQNTIWSIGVASGNWTATGILPSPRWQMSVVKLPHAVVSIGGNFYDAATPSTTFFGLNGTNCVDVASGRAAASGMVAAAAGGALFGFGGQPTSSGLLSNELWTLELTPSCSPTDEENLTTCGSCSPGTRWGAEEGVCLSCPPGTYAESFGSVECTACPAGTYNPNHGSASDKACIRCAEGTYNAKEGGVNCTACPTENYCPMGSVVDGIKSLGVSRSSSAVETQPTGIPNHSSKVTRIKRAGIGGCLGAGAFLLLVLSYAHYRGRVNLSRFDVAFTENHNFLWISAVRPMAKHQTTAGGLMTLVNLVVTCVVIIILVVPVAVDNDLEVATLVPGFTSTSKKRANFTATTTFLGFEGTGCGPKQSEGHCTAGVQARTEYVSAEGKMTCSMPDATTCRVKWTCDDCTFTGYAPSVEIVVPGAATAICWVVRTSSPYPSGRASEAQHVLFPSSGAVLRGNASSVVSLRATPSSFTTADGKTKTGYFVEYITQQAGAEADPYAFNYLEGLGVKYSFVEPDTVLVVKVQKKQNVATVFAAILGMISGINSVAVVLLRLIERIQLSYNGALHPFTSFDVLSEIELCPAQINVGGNTSPSPGTRPRLAFDFAT
eukprot:TRINITY_DN29794_c0_g1_i1.p1 TRINITY_DN29794_c0_g1~~TRINITY_DN29794_c0_g1_i1.p1  ORF type:complete len:1156 (+),score=123.18 TRINITY_DN29794_c0_g1_i1:70-3537(+)